MQYLLLISLFVVTDGFPIKEVFSEPQAAARDHYRFADLFTTAKTMKTGQKAFPLFREVNNAKLVSDALYLELRELVLDTLINEGIAIAKQIKAEDLHLGFNWQGFIQVETDRETGPTLGMKIYKDHAEFQSADGGENVAKAVNEYAQNFGRQDALGRLNELAGKTPKLSSIITAFETAVAPLDFDIADFSPEHDINDVREVTYEVGPDKGKKATYLIFRHQRNARSVIEVTTLGRLVFRPEVKMHLKGTRRTSAKPGAWGKNSETMRGHDRDMEFTFENSGLKGFVRNEVQPIEIELDVETRSKGHLKFILKEPLAGVRSYYGRLEKNAEVINALKAASIEEEDVISIRVNRYLLPKGTIIYRSYENDEAEGIL
jgi:hypothetical protein